MLPKYKYYFIKILNVLPYSLWPYVSVYREWNLDVLLVHIVHEHTYMYMGWRLSR